MSEYVSSAIINHVMHIEYHRADKKNALTTEMYSELNDAFSEARDNDDVRSIIIKGSEGCFCAGNDIADFLSQSVLGEGSPIITFLHHLADCEKPLVAAVSGPAVGIGTTMLLHCDLVYATDQTLFSLPFVNLGLCPEAGSSYLLTRQLGYAKAAELLLLGEAFNAEKAKELGIINDIIDGADYWDHAVAQAEKLAKKPAEAMRISKQLIRGNLTELKEAIDREAALFTPLLETDDAKAIFKKFLGK